MMDDQSKVIRRLEDVVSNQRDHGEREQDTKLRHSKDMAKSNNFYKCKCTLLTEQVDSLQARIRELGKGNMLSSSEFDDFSG